mgnify:CR=1 FL=1
MNYDASLKRAAALTDALSASDAVIFKVHEGESCHCFHCWPETWAAVNAFLGTEGPIKDESDLLLNTDDSVFVLECHESGPEVVACVEAAATVITAIATLITVIIAARRREAPRSSRSLKLTITRASRGLFDEESEITFELPVDESLEKLIASIVESALRRP